MFAALAELERDTIVQRTTDGRNERGRKDGERGGRVPDGYTRTPEGIMIVAERADIVRKIFDLRDQGLALRAIADQLNSDGYTTARGHKWHASSVREIMLNEAVYRGGKRGESDLTWTPILNEKKQRRSRRAILREAREKRGVDRFVLDIPMKELEIPMKEIDIPMKEL